MITRRRSSRTIKTRETELRLLVLWGQSRGGYDQKGARITFWGGDYVHPLGSGHSIYVKCHHAYTLKLCVLAYVNYSSLLK